MNVLMLYKDPGHVQPIRQARELLKERGIQMKDFHCRNHDAVRRRLKEYEASSDLLLAHSMPSIMDSAIAYDGPIMLMDRIDGAQLAYSQNLLGHEKVVGVMKGYKFKDSSLHNRFKGRYISHLMHSVGLRPAKKANSGLQLGKPTQLTEEQLASIKLIYGFEAHGHVRRLQRVKPDMKGSRQYHLHYAATNSYGGSEIEVHRKRALLQSQGYPGPKFWAPSNNVPGPAYLAAMLDSYCVVSPWGCGEGTHRHYEAMLCGCIPIIPRTDHVDCVPDIFKRETVVFCKVDFSDLHEQVRKVVDNWNHEVCVEWRQSNREMVLKHMTHESVADRVAEVLHGFSL